ncbi:MAG: pilus assembly protein [Alphaproteobacteria bacterium]|nr:MAG: pilus assembly protein [Alphaproteobacteria bacterium]
MFALWGARMIFSLRYLSKIRKNEHGVTAIEFALIAPVLFLITMGVIEFGIILFVSTTLEAAVNDAARQGTTGNAYEDRQSARNGATAPKMSREDYIRAEILRIGGTAVNPSKINISCTNLGDSFGNVTQRTSGNFQCGDAPTDNRVSCADSQLGQAGTQTAILYTATVCWELFTPLIGNFFPNNTYPIRATMLVQNEGTRNIPGNGR